MVFFKIVIQIIEYRKKCEDYAKTNFKRNICNSEMETIMLSTNRWFIVKIFKWAIDFNVMSTFLGLFCAWRLGNFIHCTFIFTFLCRYFLKVLFCTLSYKIQIILNISIWPLDGTLTGTTTPLVDLRLMAMMMYSSLLWSAKMEHHYRIQLSVIPRNFPTFYVGLTSLEHFPNPYERAI